ncbi:hypothetical protein D3C81_2338880 [compost metagenome]
MRAMVSRAVDSWPSHGAKWLPMPTPSISDWPTPHSGDKISCQMKPMMTTDSRVGRKIRVR